MSKSQNQLAYIFEAGITDSCWGVEEWPPIKRSWMGQFWRAREKSLKQKEARQQGK